LRPSSKLRHRRNSWTPHNAFAARRMRRRLEPSEDRPRSFCRCIAADGQFDGVHDAVGFGQNFDDALIVADVVLGQRSEEHTSELQSLMRISYAVFCLNK